MSIAFSEKLYTRYEAFILSDEDDDLFKRSVTTSIAEEARAQKCSFTDLMHALSNEWCRRNLQ